MITPIDRDDDQMAFARGTLDTLNAELRKVREHTDADGPYDDTARDAARVIADAVAAIEVYLVGLLDEAGERIRGNEQLQREAQFRETLRNRGCIEVRLVDASASLVIAPFEGPIVLHSGMQMRIERGPQVLLISPAGSKLRARWIGITAEVR